MIEAMNFFATEFLPAIIRIMNNFIITQGVTVLSVCIAVSVITYLTVKLVMK